MSIIQHSANHSTTDPASREIPAMSYPRRIRAAAFLAWQTLRTGQHLPTVKYMQGTRDGMDVALAMVGKSLAERAEAVAR